MNEAVMVKSADTHSEIYTVGKMGAGLLAKLLSGSACDPSRVMRRLDGEVKDVDMCKKIEKDRATLTRGREKGQAPGPCKERARKIKVVETLKASAAVADSGSGRPCGDVHEERNEKNEDNEGNKGVC